MCISFLYVYVSLPHPQWYYVCDFVTCFYYLTIYHDIFYTLKINLLLHFNSLYSSPLYVHRIIYVTIVLHIQ